MSFGIDVAKLNKIVDLYTPNNHAEEMKYMLHLRGQEELFINIQTCPFQGISNDSLTDRKSVFGINQIGFKQPSIFQPFITSLKNPIIYVPLLLSLLIFVLQALRIVGDEGYRTMLLILVCSLNWAIQSSQGFWFRLRANNANRNLQVESVEVIRENTRIRIDSNQVVVGDVVLLASGVKIPADGWIIEGQDIVVSQPYTAGSIELSKNPFRRCLSKLKQRIAAKEKARKILSEDSPVVLAGSCVKLGEGRMIVLCVGSNTKQGKLLEYSQLTHHENHTISKIQTLFSKLLNSLFVYLIGFFGLFCAKSIYKASKGSWSDLLNAQNWQEMIAIPWALVLGIPVGMHLGMVVGLWVLKGRFWMKQGIWVSGCCDMVKMATVDLLCFDKCQQKQKAVYKEWWNEQNHQQNQQDELQEKHVETEEVDLELEDISQDFKRLFEVTQLFKHCRQPQQYSTQLLIEEPQDTNEWHFIDERVNGSLVHYIVQKQTVKHVIYIDQRSSTAFVLGTAQDILESSSNFISKSTGQSTPLSTEISNHISDIISSMSRRLMCSLAIGFFSVDQSEEDLVAKLQCLANRELTFLCVLGASGMRQHSQYKIVRNLKQLGLKLMLVSDCPLQQAEKRARQIGINTVEQDTIALNGFQFNKLVQGLHCQVCKKSMCVCPEKSDTFTIKNTEELRKAQRFLRVMGEANAQQKYCLQLGMQSIGNLNAYIGSLTQDIPAMAKCYLSISARPQLSQVAAVCLPKYDFKLIYELIYWSRCSHQFVSKALQLALPASLVAVITVLIGALVCEQIVFELVPLVWCVGFICPLLTIALSLEKTQPEVLKDKQVSYSKQSHLLTWSIRKQVVCQILWQVMMLLIVMFTGHLFIPQSADSFDSQIGSSWPAKYSSDSLNLVANGLFTNPLLNTLSYQPAYQQYGLYSRHLTVVYNLYTLMQIFNCLNCRKIKDTNINILEGIGIPPVIVISAAFFSHLLFMELFCKYVGLYPEALTVQQWFISIGLAMTVCLVSFVARLLPSEKHQANKNRQVNRSTGLAVKSTQRVKQFSDFEIEEGIQFSEQ